MATPGFVRLPPDALGKGVLTYEVVIGGNPYHAEALVLVDATTGAPIDLATLLAPVAKELTERMLAKQPAAGYRLWFDTADTGHIYILEALAAKAAGDTGFRGIRITKDASGNPLGKVQVNESATLTFNNRLTDPGWS